MKLRVNIKNGKALNVYSKRN